MEPRDAARESETTTPSPMRPFPGDEPSAAFAPRPRLLDLFCCEGGAGTGYYMAGFDVVGVDVAKQPRYPFPFFQADALAFVEEFGIHFDAIHASPPCQAFTKAHKLQGNEHPDLITPLRPILQRLGKPYVIENVEGAPLHAPVTLCGASFGLRTYRHRLFETNWTLPEPVHQPHHAPLTKMGRPPVDGEFMHIVGHFSGVPEGQKAMGMPWGTQGGLREAIPPAYTLYIGGYLMEHVESEALRAAA